MVSVRTSIIGRPRRLSRHRRAHPAFRIYPLSCEEPIIDQDALGLARIYVQAKRYAEGNTVGRPAIQEFVGALSGNGANQGVFITTSRFTKDAEAFVEKVSARIVLIGGEQLSGLMIRYGVGVQLKRTIRIVKIDEDYFESGT